MDAKTKQRLVLSVLFFCYLKTHVSLAADSITANQSLSGDQTIVSAGGIFELGFFTPGNSSNFYIGMWYTKQVVSERTIVWVANREKPVSDRFSSVLRISDGNLVLLNESKTPIWSTNLTSSSATTARLLDTGNLVLVSGSGNSTSEALWQSFDHPAHTWLPGGRIGFNTVTQQTQILTSWKSSEDPAPGLFSLELDPNGSNAYLILWNRSIQYWTSGSWDAKSKIFWWVPEMRLNYIYNFSYFTNETESYITYSVYDPRRISRFVMHTSGQIQQQTWLETSGQWNLFWSQPRKQCKVYDLCGAFGSCNEVSNLACNCLNGFEPKSKRDWDLMDYSGGCSRKTRLYCANGKPDRFLEFPSMSLPENEQSVEVGSIAECESFCLRSCSCTAYAYSRSECSVWKGELLDLQQLTSSDDQGGTLYLKLAASEFKSSKSNEGLMKSNKVLIVGVVAGSTAGVAVLLGLIVFAILRRRKQVKGLGKAVEGGTDRANKHRSDKRTLVIALVSATAGLLTMVSGYFLWKKSSGRGREHRRKYGETKGNVGAASRKNSTELPLFRLRSIVAATNNFSEAKKLGLGGFGPVYKGILIENEEVAIKKLSKRSGQGHEEFMNELNLIAKLQHTNLVRLLGCCIEDEEMILIYEYMPNRSLDRFLFDSSEKTKLDWGTRFRIIEGVAQGVLYIHKYSRLKIIHRDLKASNVLLDGKMKPKISDFGMAKIFGMDQTEANTNRVVGTYGYMSPEYALYGHFSEKLDVFSFGVLLLEILSGKRNSAFHRFEDPLTVAGWAWKLWNEGRGIEVIDESLRETCQRDEALRCIHVGFLCVQEAPADRPTMSSVIRMLQSNEATSLPPSKEPAFSIHRGAGAVGCPSQTPASFSNNELTRQEDFWDESEYQTDANTNKIVGTRLFNKIEA